MDLKIGDEFRSRFGTGESIARIVTLSPTHLEMIYWHEAKPIQVTRCSLTLEFFKSEACAWRKSLVDAAHSRGIA